MRINRPGPYSKLISPIQVEALISPGEDGFVYVDLIGEDGRYLVRQALDFRAYRDRRFYIAPEVPFEIEKPAEVARLVLYTRDRFGRTIYLCATDVVLQQLGRNVLEAPWVDHRAPSWCVRRARARRCAGGSGGARGGAPADQPADPDRTDCTGWSGGRFCRSVAGDALRRSEPCAV